MATKAEEEIQKMRELEERIKAPSVWSRLPIGIRIEDLQENRYEEAVQLVKEHYMNEEILFKTVKILEDKESTDEFVHNCRVWLRDKMSLAAVKEGTGKLVGVLIMRIQEKAAFSRTFSKVKLTYSPLYSIVTTFTNEVQKSVCLFKQLDVRKYLKIYLVALLPRYRHRGVTKDLMKAAISVSINANIPAIAGIFTTGRLQTIADQLGLVKYNEIYYVRYLVNGELVFTHMGLSNYGAALMAYRIPEVEEPPAEEAVRAQSSRFHAARGGEESPEEGGGHDQEANE